MQFVPGGTANLAVLGGNLPPSIGGECLNQTVVAKAARRNGSLARSPRLLAGFLRPLIPAAPRSLPRFRAALEDGDVQRVNERRACEVFHEPEPGLGEVTLHFRQRGRMLVRFSPAHGRADGPLD